MVALTERTSRFTLLATIDRVDSQTVVEALRRHIVGLPDQLRRSVTCDQGKEMARHLQLAIDTGVQVFFCDPTSPWQPDTNQNTNGLLRQYFPKRTDLTAHSQDHLDHVAAQLNGRPRKTLGYLTPAEKLDQVLH